MLTDSKIIGKLDRIEQRYRDFCYEKLADVSMEMCETKERLRSAPVKDSTVSWHPAHPGTKWGDNFTTAWFRGGVRLPKECSGQKVFIRALTNGETLFIVDGDYRGVFDGNHPVVMMTAKGIAGRTYELSLEAYAGHSIPGCGPDEKGDVVGPKGKVFGGVQVLLVREDVVGFVHDLRVLVQLVGSHEGNTLDKNSLRRHRIIRGLADVFAIVDAMPQETGEANWRPKLADARRIMRPLLAVKNGPTTPWFGIIGHSHIDNAWLWPLAETWRKCARTFSSVLNLMEQYPEFMFLQSTPCQTDMIRKEYPGLFERIREKVKSGRWEPNGAMWVEADCNIPSGESFVRQLLVGQTATREMFGYTSDTLWLPDVFGYSAALPQILKECGVHFFCTTKISWNDTTRFAYDTFRWKGIDGTSVITHFNSVGGGTESTEFIGQWNSVQHKDVQDRRLYAFGYGDGGGGPTAAMCESARRLEDIDGCPRTHYMTVSDFMKSIRGDLTDLPEWAGELYLEGHRGTLTSIAMIKRRNRQAEYALREAEYLSTLAALSGAAYPSDRLDAIWKKVLTNQFHDVLPGTSIALVNDEAIRDFDACILEAGEVGRDAVIRLAGPASSRGTGLRVINSLSWDRTGELVLDAPRQHLRPSGPDVVAQRVEDVEGCPKLIVAGLTVPAFGSIVIPMAKADMGDEASPFKVSASKVETPYATVRFDKTGRITSFVDKASGRQIVRAGGVLNGLLIGEDVPSAWDNWDIDSDQRLKMSEDQRLLKRTVSADGPLQLRIRSEYEIGVGSRMTQDIIFHSGSGCVDFESVIDWNEQHKLLKAGFDLDILSDFARHEIQYGHLERSTHCNLPQDRARFEVCAHKWTDLSENGFGVALLNDCKYGIGVRNNTLRLSLMKSGTHPDARGDSGRHCFTYSLLPHACGFSVDSVVRPAYELNIPVTTWWGDAGAQGWDSLLTVDAAHVIVESVKWAEKGKAFVVRLYEAGKTGARVMVTFNTAVGSVCQVNMLEEEPRPLKIRGQSVSFTMRPFEIVTLVVQAQA